ncbi:AAA family ATPase [Geodermatophilus sp. SYSU D00965]
MRARLMTPPLVGRERQLVTLRRLWEGAEAAMPAVALLVGEAGSGKTRLAAELVDEVSRRGGRALRGECLPLGGQDLPYGPFLGVLDDVLTVPDLPEGLRGDVSRLLSAVESAPDLDAIGTGVRAGGSTHRGRLFQQCLRAVTELAAQFPVLLVLEDVHWADRSSLDLLAFLVAGLREQRLLVLVTARDDESSAESTRTLLTELRRRGSATAVDLPPLDDAAVHALLDAGGGLPGHVRREIARRADGNPFYALELRTAWERGAAVLPDEVADAALSRLRGLAGDAAELLRSAAAIGREFTDELLEAVLDLPESRRLAALRELLDRGALVPDGEAYRFRHALLQEAVYARLPPAERRRVHRAVAPALQRVAEQRGPDLGTAVALSFHWRAAAEPTAALAAAVTAEALARHAHAHGEAARQAESALAVWDAASERPSGTRLVPLLLQAAEDRRWAGDLGPALAHARRAVALAVDRGSPLEEAMALERLGQLVWADGDLSGALDLHERAVTLARDQGMTPVTARALASWATRLSTAGQFARAASVAEEAVEAARTLELTAVEAHALTTWGTSQGVSGELEAGLERLSQARDLARRTGDAEELMRVFANQAFVLLEAGRPADAGDTAAEGVAELTSLDVPRSMLAVLITNLAVAHLRAGRLTEAREVAEAGLEDWGPLDRQYLQGLLVEVHLTRGDTASARLLLEDMRTAAESVTDPRITAGLRGLEIQLALLEGRGDDGLRIAAEAVRDLPGVGLQTTALRLCAVCTRALAHVRARRSDAALRSGMATVEHAVVEVLTARRGDPDRCSLHERALLAQCEAELDPESDAQPGTRWAIAAGAWRAAGQPHDVAYALLRQAEDLAAGRRRREAADRLGEAETLLVDLGATPLLRRAQLLRDAIAVQASPVRDSGRTPPEDPISALGVTVRERQVLDLLMRGRTNRQIGRALSTTERTAATHVSNLLRKLGVSSRVEAVSLAHRLLVSEADSPAAER